jgi:hypothetical protein
MGVLDGLKSRADEINRGRVARDIDLARRASKRPDWLPDDWPEGVPYVNIAGGYSGRPNPESEIRDTVTHHTVDPDETGGDRLTDAQLAGYAIQGELAARQTVTAELRHLQGRLNAR